jgi:hypothetical protein
MKLEAHWDDGEWALTMGDQFLQRMSPAEMRQMAEAMRDFAEEILPFVEGPDG